MASELPRFGKEADELSMARAETEGPMGPPGGDVRKAAGCLDGGSGETKLQVGLWAAPALRGKILQANEITQERL